jgi:hypothetical protein
MIDHRDRAPTWKKTFGHHPMTARQPGSQEPRDLKSIPRPASQGATSQVRKIEASLSSRQYASRSDRFTGRENRSNS